MHRPPTNPMRTNPTGPRGGARRCVRRSALGLILPRSRPRLATATPNRGLPPKHRPNLLPTWRRTHPVARAGGHGASAVANRPSAKTETSFNEKPPGENRAVLILEISRPDALARGDRGLDIGRIDLLVEIGFQPTAIEFAF